MLNRNITLFEASEMALKQLNDSANLGEILRTIKENGWYEFQCAPKSERTILTKSITRNKRIIKDTSGNYNLARSTDSSNSGGPQMKEDNTLKKIFISHYSKDEPYVKRIINTLERIGIASNQILCSSYESYGVPADGDIFEWIKNSLKSEDTLVLFVMSEDYFTRPVCLCEMGACIVNSHKYIPILIPPLDFQTMQKGMIPGSKKAYMIDDIKGLTGIKEAIEKNFGLEPIRTSVWNDYLEDYSTLIKGLIQQDKVKKEEENRSKKRIGVEDYLNMIRDREDN